MILSNLAFCVMAGLVRYAETIDSYKTSLFRFVIGLALLGVAALWGKIELKFVHGPFLFLRGFFGGIAVFLFYLSIIKLGVGKGTVLSYTYPIFASIFGVIFLKEKIGIYKWIAILAALAGIYLLAVKPNSSFSSGYALGKYEMLSVLGAVLAGIAVVLVRHLHLTDSTYAIFFSQCAVGLWLVIIPANLVPLTLGYAGGVLLLCIGISATVAQLLMTESYRYLSVTVGSLLALLVPVLNMFIGVFLFRESLSLRSIIGALIVILACTLVLIQKDNNQSKIKISH